MNRPIRAWTIPLVVLVAALTACGGKGCGGTGTPPAQPAAPAEAPPAPEAAPADTAPSPAPAATVGFLEGLAPRLPAQVSSVAVFPATRIHDAVRRLPGLLPNLAWAASPEDFAKRLKTIYGVDLTGVDGMCAVAMVQEAGPLVVCPGGKLSAVENGYRWVAGVARGHNVTRYGIEVSVALVDGHLVAGSTEAVQRAVRVSQGSWPKLSDARSRWMPIVTELAGHDAFGQSGLFYLDPSTAPWCGGDCVASAVFDNGAAVRAIAIAQPGKGAAVQARAAAWWQSVGRSLSALMALPLIERPLRMPEPWLKPADLLASSGVLSLRGDHLFFDGSGDAVALLVSLNAELPRRWLADIPSAAGKTLPPVE